MFIVVLVALVVPAVLGASASATSVLCLNARGVFTACTPSAGSQTPATPVPKTPVPHAPNAAPTTGAPHLAKPTVIVRSTSIALVSRVGPLGLALLGAILLVALAAYAPRQFRS